MSQTTTGQLVLNGRQQFFDRNGDPLVAGKVYFYAPSTTTPVDTYQDKDLTILNANPVVLDGGGYATIYSAVALRQVVRDRNGNLIWDALTGMLDFGMYYTQDGTGAERRSVSDRLKEKVSVLDFVPNSQQANILNFAYTYDCTTAINNALATGKWVEMPRGGYKTTGPLRLTRSDQQMLCEGAILRPSGNFNVVEFDGVGNHAGISGLVIEAGSMTGGASLSFKDCGRIYLSEMFVSSPFNGFFVQDCNNIHGTSINLNQVRGSYAYQVYGSGSGAGNDNKRVDIVRLYGCGAACSDAAALAGCVGLLLNGAANSVETTNFHLVRPGVGIKAQPNGVGAAPFGLVCHGVAASDYAAFESVRLEAGEDFYFGTGFYAHAAGTKVFNSSYNEVNGVYIAPGVQNVQFCGGKITDARNNCIATEGKGVVIQGMKIVKSVSPDQACKYDAIYVGSAAYSTRIVGNEIGVRYFGAQQVGYGVIIQPGAEDTVITGNDFHGSPADPVMDLSNSGQLMTTMMGNGGSYRDESRGIRISNWAGANCFINATVSNGSVNAVFTLNVGSGYDSTDLPEVFVKGDGTGAVVTVTKDGNGGLVAALANGGSGYTWARVFVKPRLTTPTVSLGGTATGGSNIRYKARGGGEALIGNDRGNGLVVRAPSNTVNAVIATGAAAGGAVVVGADGASGDIPMVVSAKGIGTVSLRNALASFIDAVGADTEPRLQAQGGPASIPLRAWGKGDGGVYLGNERGDALRISTQIGAVNYATITAKADGVPVIAPEGAGAVIDISLVPKNVAGGGRVNIDAPIGGAPPGAAISSAIIKINGTERRIALYTV